ncbi:DUF2169 domain-containing protein [Bordetella sp. BOR01]|uniref:DUF2169 family type VI secretion system accessory protein n=1 Tax=Bordetella sp. BOR01 TaxID=2854779 RepID=UPI001C486896|nr:DUF2169 domain-containing protein [Bordetella sp. BOR01]MBV7486026.1 DUF2169 domain-containing protein [Bordetella sp. BOR01]
MKIAKPDDVILLLGRQSHGGQPSLTVTVGYACGTDGVRLTEQQAWAWLAPMFDKEPFDLAEKKLRGSYAVAGSACAPAGEAITGITVRAGVGGLEKNLLVQGDRYWTRGMAGWQASTPQAFERMPLDLTRAYGARGWLHNPQGRGHCADPDQAEGTALPNVEHPRHPVIKPSDVPPLATLGPLPQGSPGRTRWLGTLDATWQRRRLPWLPDDTDPRWFDRMEQDQCQDGYWRGDESWFAEHMHPRHAMLRGRLPGLRPRLLLRSDRAPQQRGEAQLDLDTVWLFPTDERVVVLYRASVAVRREDAEDMLGLAVFTETRDQAAQSTEHWAAVWRQQEEAAAAPARPVAPVAAESEAARAAAAAEAEVAAQAAQVHKEAVLKEIADEQQQAIDEADQYRKAMGLPPVSAKLAESRAQQAHLVESVPDDWPDEPVAFTRAVHAYIDKQLAEAEAEARAFMKAQGRDFDQAMAKARAEVSLYDNHDTAKILAAMPMAPERKQALLQKYQVFAKKMDALEAETAEIEQRADAMAAEQARPAPPGIDEPLPPGPRTALDRETLLARHAAGQSCAWALLQDLDLSDVSLRGVDLSRAQIERCILRRADLDGAKFHETDLRQCDLAEARLDGSDFNLAMLTGCALDGVSAQGADFSQARLKTVSLAKAVLGGTQWAGAQVGECGFEQAAMQAAQAGRAQFTACRLPGLDAGRGDFTWATFDQCVLTDAVFEGATLAHATLIACQASGSTFVDARMPGLRTLKNSDLSRARLDRANMEGASLQGCCLAGATLRETRLDRGLVKNCDLTGTDAWHLTARAANFSGSRIAQASWRGANLMQSHWQEAVLEDVDMSGVNLHAADTRRASTQGLQLGQALLTRCRLVEDYAHG